MSERPFTVSDSVRLEPIVHAAQRKSRVIRWIKETDAIVHDTARSVCDEYHCASPRSDIRDLFLWVTTDGGFETLWSVSELMDDVSIGHFVTGVEAL